MFYNQPHLSTIEIDLKDYSITVFTGTFAHCMLHRIQKKWDVNGWRFLVILITFAVGGSLTGYLGKQIMSLLQVDQPVVFIIIYILIVTLLWPFMVLAVSIPFGQFIFFRKYIRNLLKRLVSKKSVDELNRKKRIAIFASGAGSNAKKIIEYFNTSSSGSDFNKTEVALIVCNNPEAGVLIIGQEKNVPVLIINKHRFFNADGYLPELKEKNIHLIVLAGFLWKIPQIIIDAFPRSIINIHPALLPKYGGKGMYGNNVHKAVIEAGEKYSGITIHYVDEHYDNGDIIFQQQCEVKENDTAELLAERIHHLEHEYYPKIIASLLK